MKKSRFTESQIVSTLKEGEAGRKATEICRKHGISGATYYNWQPGGGALVSLIKQVSMCIPPFGCPRQNTAWAGTPRYPHENEAISSQQSQHNAVYTDWNL